MDVTGWTIDQKMRLPDWCFGNRQVIGVYVSTWVPGGDAFAIAEIPLPDPVCIWQMAFVVTYEAGASGHARAGLSHTLPANVAEMNAATEIYPYFGTPMAGPNALPDLKGTGFYGEVAFKKGIVTDGMYIVGQVHCTAIMTRLNFWLLVSGLPTDMAGWMEHSLV